MLKVIYTGKVHNYFHYKGDAQLTHETQNWALNYTCNVHKVKL